jgi:murein DD-endopeptidase MepM/ murein hydrolase activator NlpD
VPLNTSARIGLVALLATGVAACAPGGSDFDREWAAQQSAAASSASTSPSTPSSPSASPSPQKPEKPVNHVFPVRSGKAHYAAYHHDYPAADIFAPCGTRVAAPYTGRISEVSRTDVWSAETNEGAVRGGLSFTLVGDDGVRYYGSHLRRLDPAIKAGARVEAGDTIGRVGNTGDAAGIACHLHFGISPPCGVGDWQVLPLPVPACLAEGRRPVTGENGCRMGEQARLFSVGRGGAVPPSRLRTARG